MQVLQQSSTPVSFFNLRDILRKITDRMTRKKIRNMLRDTRWKSFVDHLHERYPFKHTILLTDAHGARIWLGSRGVHIRGSSKGSYSIENPETLCRAIEDVCSDTELSEFCKNLKKICAQISHH